MSEFYQVALLDPHVVAEAKSMLGDSFERLVGYFCEDGPRAIAGIEHGLAHGNAGAIVPPAHKLKGEAAQLGALRLAALAQAIETEARECVEEKRALDGIVTEVAMLRACFQQSITLMLPESALSERVSIMTPDHTASRASTIAPITAMPKPKPVFGKRSPH